MQEAISILHNEQVMRGMAHLPEREKTPAVILLHGFTGTKLEPHRFFLKVSRQLEAIGIASFRFDFLGSGESDDNFEEMTLLKELDQANTILDYVKSHPVIDENRITVLGFSMGGLVASLLAGDRSEEIEKLILLAPAGNMAEAAEEMERSEPFIESKNAFDIGGNLISYDFINELKTVEVWERASSFKNPVLLIHGTKDQAVPIEESHSFVEKSYQGQSKLVEIEGADHTFNSFHWESQVIAEIVTYLDREGA